MENNLRCKICGSVLIGVMVVMHVPVCDYCHRRMQKEHHVIELWPSAIELAEHDIGVVSTSGSIYNINAINFKN